MSFSRWSNKRHDKQPQGPFRQQFRQRRGKQGQNMIEYMLIFAAAVAVMVVALNPKGFVTRAVSKSINMMFDSVEDMASEPCLGTIDDVDGGWSNWGSWGACSGCVQTRTRSCTNPSPKCGGAECTRADSSLTSPTNRSEAETQSCLSGTWVTGACGVCTGSCGSTVGTCTRLVTCPSGCCAPPAPVSVMSCTKPEYPDVWSGLGFGACSTTCDKGIASQVVTCSGMCCDALLKPPTRQACTDGCCARTMDIGLDIVNNVQFTAIFGPAANGQPFSVSCPSGYAGNPTSTCTATANLSCTGNDSYVPPASCYNISWGPVSNTCVPADCSTVSVDAGYGRMWDVPFTLHGNTATLNCSDGGWSYTGTASYDCWKGEWLNLNAGCIPNCPAQTLDIGAGIAYPFPETSDPTGVGVTVNYTCDTSDKIGLPCAGLEKYEGAVSRTCTLGTWSAVSGACSYKSCPAGMMVCDDNGVCVAFPKADHGISQTVACPAGYTESLTATCEYGTWCGRTGNCVTAAQCTELDLDTTKWKDVLSGILPASPVGTKQLVSCDQVPKEVTVRCMEDLQWGVISGNCSTTCPKEDQVEVGDGTVSVQACFPATNSGNTAYAWNSGCDNPFFSCGGIGYTGSPRRVCTNGVWGGIVIPCRKCDKLCSAGFVNIGYYPEYQPYYTYRWSEGACGSPQWLSCPTGYTGGYGLYCKLDGEWTHTDQCQKQSCTDPQCGPAECNTSKTKCDGTTLTCRACVCTNIPSNASQCWGDNPSSTATADIAATLVDATCTGAIMTMGCTTTKQCEYYCDCLNDYVKSADGKSCGTSCTCPAPGSYTNAIVGSGTNNCNDTRTVTCETGYTGTPNSTTITCSSTTKTWTGTGPTCTETCPAGQVPTGSCPAGQYDTGGCSVGYYCASPPCP